MIVLGNYVRDDTTGYTGTATARCEHLEGPSRIQVERDGDANRVWFEA